ncbi:MAG: nucleotide exchange factor GrpE [Flavobacteriales bacterium]|nr:nucleotide exchange factor GrpE [Flavobacteriales bacterium]
MDLERKNASVEEEVTDTASATASEGNEGEESSSEATSSPDDGDESTASSQSEEQTDWQDRYLRLYAEFDNYRKRTMRERVELIRTASRDSIEKILPILDDFSRAEAASLELQDAQALKEGQHLIHTKFKQLMETQGVKVMAVETGDVFDVDFHEAITRIPSPELSGKVVDVVESGYLLNDAVIRYAKVVVGE